MEKKKRKKFAVILMVLFIFIFMTGCSVSEQDNEAKDIVEAEEEEFETFVVLSKKSIPHSDITQYILYDPDTMVMWTFMDGYRCGGPAVIYNADGTPKIYEP